MSDWQKKLEYYDKLIDTNPKFERKGKNMIFTSANGYMFSILNKDGEIGIRLSKEEGKKFMEEYNATEFRSYGAKMKDYVEVPDELWDNMDLLADLIDRSYEYVMSLEPNDHVKKKK